MPVSESCSAAVVAGRRSVGHSLVAGRWSLVAGHWSLSCCVGLENGGAPIGQNRKKMTLTIGLVVHAAGNTPPSQFSPVTTAPRGMADTTLYSLQLTVFQLGWEKGRVQKKLGTI